MTDFAISLWESLMISDTFISSVAPNFVKWKHSSRSLGGNWLAEGDYIGTAAEMEEFFLSNLGRRLVVDQGSIPWWEGQIVRMEYRHKGQRFVRSMEEMANRTKVIYSKVGDNLLTNGDVESGAWTKLGSPPTHETTTDWYARGTTAMHVVTNWSDQGTQPNASAVTISAGVAYTASVIVNIVSGTWTLRVIDTGTSAVIGTRESAGTGRQWLQCQVPDTHTSTSVNVQLRCAAGETYADGAVFRTAPVRSETKWWPNADSIAAYGRKELALLEREMTDDEADSMAQRELDERAWIRTRSPSRGRTFEEIRDEDSLIITCMGMAWTLGWRYALTEGTADADTHITALVDESEFISSSDAIIDTNTSEVYLDVANPVTLWDQIEKIVDVGDGSGAVWMAGVYPGRRFLYEARPTTIEYEFHKGKMREYKGSQLAPVEFRPGWCWMTDMPVEPIPAGATATIDDPRAVWLDETWFEWDRKKGATLRWYEEDEDY